MTDYLVLEHLNLAKEVRWLIDFGSLNHIFSIEEQKYWKPTFKVLSRFEVDQSPVGYVKPREIYSKLSGEP